VDEKPLYEGSFTVMGGNFDNAGEVSSNIKTVLKQIGLPKDVIRKVALVAYESEINIVSYARKGMIRLRVVPESIMIEAIDEGQGIPDIEQAMQPGFSTANQKIREMGFGAGMGLCNIKSFSDVFHISSEVGKGTHLRMIIRASSAALNS
jgi:anti-sigma regulatory factor (Ser/Thr protein kinase)